MIFVDLDWISTLRDWPSWSDGIVTGPGRKIVMDDCMFWGSWASYSNWHAGILGLLQTAILHGATLRDWPSWSDGIASGPGRKIVMDDCFCSGVAGQAIQTDTKGSLDYSRQRFKFQKGRSSRRPAYTPTCCCLIKPSREHILRTAASCKWAVCATWTELNWTFTSQVSLFTTVINR